MLREQTWKLYYVTSLAKNIRAVGEATSNAAVEIVVCLWQDNLTEPISLQADFEFRVGLDCLLPQGKWTEFALLISTQLEKDGFIRL